MSHLSPQEISKFLVGDLSPQLEEHADQCSQCKARLTQLESSLSHFRSSVRNLKENEMTTITRIHTGNETMAGFTSLLVHCGAVALLLLIGTMTPAIKQLTKESITLVAPSLKPAPTIAHGGGGGGARSPLEASKGKLPQVAPKQFTPPRVDTFDAKLPMTPTIVASEVPNIVASNMGDPMGKMGPASNGTGFGGGIGSGSGGGVGPGHGPGVGPGSGGGFGGAVFKIGGGVMAPSIIHKIEPEYSEEARKAKWQGTVTLSVIVDETGHARNLQVTQSLGLGLDQKAMEAVEKWLFKPATKDGKAVAVFATVQVTFHLL